MEKVVFDIQKYIGAKEAEIQWLGQPTHVETIDADEFEHPYIYYGKSVKTLRYQNRLFYKLLFPDRIVTFPIDIDITELSFDVVSDDKRIVGASVSFNTVGNFRTRPNRLLEVVGIEDAGFPEDMMPLHPYKELTRSGDAEPDPDSQNWVIYYWWHYKGMGITIRCAYEGVEIRVFQILTNPD